MVLLRALDNRTDYLALADATLLLHTAHGLKVLSDERVNQLTGKERAAGEPGTGWLGPEAPATRFQPRASGGPCC